MGTEFQDQELGGFNWTKNTITQGGVDCLRKTTNVKKRPKIKEFAKNVF